MPETNLPYASSGRLEMLTPKLLVAVAGEPTLYGALATVAQGFVEVFGALAANVRVLRADGRTLDLVSACGLGAGDESPNIDVADANPAARAVRKRSIQFVSETPGPRGPKATRVHALPAETLFSLPLVGDERILGAVTGRFDVPLAPNDCEQLADLGQLLGALIEIGLLSPSAGPGFESPPGDPGSKSGFLPIKA